MVLCFVTKAGKRVRLGTFMPVHKDDLKKYIRENEIHWVQAGD